jgi:hypothetical protein
MLQRLVGLDGAILGNPTQQLLPIWLNVKHPFVDKQVRKFNALDLGFGDHFISEPGVTGSYLDLSSQVWSFFLVRVVNPLS